MADIVNRYPVGGTFENIREGKYLYIDKTRYIIDFRKKGMKLVHTLFFCAGALALRPSGGAGPN